MSAREAYARAVYRVGACEMIAGLEIRSGDDICTIRKRLVGMMALAWADLEELRNPSQDYEMAEGVERRVRTWWPDRAFFLEVGVDADREGWVQVFQPYGLPRTTR